MTVFEWVEQSEKQRAINTTSWSFLGNGGGWTDYLTVLACWNNSLSVICGR